MGATKTDRQREPRSSSPWKHPKFVAYSLLVTLVCASFLLPYCGLWQAILDYCEVCDLSSGNFVDPKKIMVVILAAWLFIWLFLSVRAGLGPSGLPAQFRFAGLSFEERRRELYGREFCQFMVFCRQKLPGGSTFLFVGPDDQSVQRPRAYLELYPHLPCDRPDYLVVYQAPGYSPPNSSMYARFSPGNYILSTLKKP
jgi:hypothetical protein